MAEELPLTILLLLMRRMFRNKDTAAAVAMAKITAPYMHGRAPVARAGGDLAEVSDEELERAGWDLNENEFCGESGGAAEDEDTEKPW